MRAAPAGRQTASPLSSLGPDDRERVIRAIAQTFTDDEVITILTALAGSPREAAALADPLQDRLQEIVLRSFPPGRAAVVVSQLGIARVPTESWLPKVQERFAGQGVDSVADALAGIIRDHQRDRP